MESDVSIIIMVGFFLFLLVVIMTGTQSLQKSYKLSRYYKPHDGTRSGHSTKPIYIFRNNGEKLHDYDPDEGLQNAVYIPITENGNYTERKQTHRQKSN